jgi:hypothetical protein
VEARLSYTWETLISDLDRCEHGRHSTDSCFSCPDGKSTGNLELKPGSVIGHTLHGTYKIVVPEPEVMHDPAEWLVRAAG